MKGISRLGRGACCALALLAGMAGMAGAAAQASPARAQRDADALERFGEVMRAKGRNEQCKVLDECVQLFGGYGYMWEYPIARAWADARVQRIYGGTNEIMKEVITRAMGLPAR